MKNLLIYITPQKDFISESWNNEINLLVKIQIDNSLNLGWKKEDILLVTNFDYEYRGIKSLIIGDDNYCSFSPTASKINAIVALFGQGIIGEDLYWFHDFDVFQLEKITESELGLDGVDMALTEYGRTTVNLRADKRPSTGSVFFKKSSEDIFNWIKIKVHQYECNEEVALLELTKIKKYNINERMKRLNITYNLATRKRNVKECYEMAEKPLRVIHFHPFDKRPVDLEDGNDNMAVCVYGKNRLNKVLVSNELIELFKKHGIK